MKKRSAFLIVMILVMLFGMRVTAHAEQLPLEIRAEYLENQEELLVQVIAKEPIVLNAFTISIGFDNQVYELYEGYDEIQNGYEYAKEFQEQYQNGGMMLSNAVEDKVLFSGVNQSEDKAYQGIVAEAALLNYNASDVENVGVYLEISALHINGNTVNLTEENKKIFCQMDTQNDSIPDSTDGIVSNISEEGKKVVSEQPLATTIMKQDAQPSLEHKNNIINQQNKTEELMNQSIGTQQAVTGEIVVNEDNVSTINTTKPENSRQQKARINSGWIIMVPTVCIVIIVTVLFIKNKKRRSE